MLNVITWNYRYFFQEKCNSLLMLNVKCNQMLNVKQYSSPGAYAPRTLRAPRRLVYKMRKHVFEAIFIFTKIKICFWNIVHLYEMKTHLPWVSNLFPPPVLWADFLGQVPWGDPFVGDIFLDTSKYGGGNKLLTHGNIIIKVYIWVI